MCAEYDILMTRSVNKDGVMSMFKFGDEAMMFVIKAYTIVAHFVYLLERSLCKYYFSSLNTTTKLNIGPPIR